MKNKTTMETKNEELINEQRLETEAIIVQRVTEMNINAVNALHALRELKHSMLSSFSLPDQLNQINAAVTVTENIIRQSCFYNIIEFIKNQPGEKSKEAQISELLIEGKVKSEVKSNDQSPYGPPPPAANTPDGKRRRLFFWLRH